MLHLFFGMLIWVRLLAGEPANIPRPPAAEKYPAQMTLAELDLAPLELPALAAGAKVYHLNENARIKLDGELVPDTPLLYFPGTVLKVEGNWLLMKVNQETGEAWVYRADVGTSDEALAHYSKCIAEHPQEERNYRYRGYIHERLDRLEDALADADQVVRLLPSNYSWTHRASVYTKLGKYDEALQDFDRALQATPDST